MDYVKLYEAVRDEAFAYRRAVGNVAFPAPYMERMKNTLFNHLDEIEAALKFASEAQKQIDVLTVEIESADAELKAKDDEIKSLKAPQGKSRGNRAKIAVVDEFVE